MKAQNERKERVRIDTDRLELEAARIALSDIRNLVSGGCLLRVEDIPDELATAIASIEIVTKNLIDGEVERTAKVRFWDKPSAILTLLKLRGKLNDRKVTVKAELDAAVEAKQQLEAIALALCVEDLQKVNWHYEQIAMILTNSPTAGPLARAMGD